MILSDRDIVALIALGDLVVEPLDKECIRENGLDLRLGRGYCRFRRTGRVLDPRRPGEPWEYYECGEGDEIVVGPGEHILLHTLEYIRLPPYLAGLVNLRSTWARTGIYIPSTVVDAGFEGQLTIEIVGSSFPVKLYPGDRFLHLVLVRLNTPAKTPYSGQYQGQKGVRLPKFFAATRGS
ncbi:MAG: dCTP deaminase [Desulfurococcales archaeon]|nr:dCTP deaminase [Desulfurococcales archaeon]